MRKSVLVVGTCTVDITVAPIRKSLGSTSTTARIHICPGGSCRNVAENLARLGTNVILLSSVGADEWGNWVRSECEHAAVFTKFVVEPDVRTPLYVALLGDDGSVLFDCIDDGGTFDRFDSSLADFLHDPTIDAPDMVVTSTDIGDNLFGTISGWASQRGIDVALGASSLSTCSKVLGWLKQVDHLFLNRAELAVILGRKDDRSSSIERDVRSLCRAGPKTVVCSSGAGAIYFCSRDRQRVHQASPFAPKSQVLSSVGCGDALESGVIWGLLNGLSTKESIQVGLAAASITLQSLRSSSEDLCLETICSYLDRVLTQSGDT